MSRAVLELGHTLHRDIRSAMRLSSEDHTLDAGRMAKIFRHFDRLRRGRPSGDHYQLDYQVGHAFAKRAALQAVQHADSLDLPPTHFELDDLALALGNTFFEPTRKELRAGIEAIDRLSAGRGDQLFDAVRKAYAALHAANNEFRDNLPHDLPAGHSKDSMFSNPINRFHSTSMNPKRLSDLRNNFVSQLKPRPQPKR